MSVEGVKGGSLRVGDTTQWPVHFIQCPIIATVIQCLHDGRFPPFILVIAEDKLGEVAAIIFPHIPHSSLFSLEETVDHGNSAGGSGVMNHESDEHHRRVAP